MIKKNSISLDKILFFISDKKILFFTLVFYFVINFAFELVGLGTIISFSSITLDINESSNIVNKIPFSNIFSNNVIHLGLILMFFLF